MERAPIVKRTFRYRKVFHFVPPNSWPKIVEREIDAIGSRAVFLNATCSRQIIYDDDIIS